MFIPEGLMHKKVKLWLALLIIVIIALIAAFGISAKAATTSNQKTLNRITVGTTAAVGAASLYFGGKVKANIFCTPATAVCSCPSGFFRVVITPFGSGSAKTFCYNSYMPRIGPMPAPGTKVLGLGIKAGIEIIPIIFAVTY